MAITAEMAAGVENRSRYSQLLKDLPNLISEGRKPDLVPFPQGEGLVIVPNQSLGPNTHWQKHLKIGYVYVQSRSGQIASTIRGIRVSAFEAKLFQAARAELIDSS